MPPPPGTPAASRRRRGHGDERLVGDLPQVEAGHAEGLLPLLRRRGLADGAGQGDVGLLVLGHAEPEGREPERLDDAAVHGGSEVDAVDALEELGEDPVGGRGVVLERCAGLPVEAPARERLEAGVAGAPVGEGEGRVGEARGVEQDLLDGDRLLAVGGELGDAVADALVEPQRPSARTCQMAEATTALVQE